MSKKLGLGVFVAVLMVGLTASCSLPTQGPVSGPQIVTVEVPGAVPTVVVTEVNWTVVAPTALPSATIDMPVAPSPTPSITAVISQWADGQRVENQLVYSHPWTTSAMAFLVPVGTEVTVLGKANSTLFPSGDWRCIEYEGQFGWMDKDQFTEEEYDPASLPVFEANPSDPGIDACFNMN